MPFPINRPRRLRQNEAIRTLVRETEVNLSDLIAPIFVKPGRDLAVPIEAMPGFAQLSPDRALKEALTLKRLGVKAVLLFGIPDHKDACGDVACRDDGIVQLTIREIKKEIPDLLVVADLCFCEYTTHGHCGVLVDDQLDNDLTLTQISKQALSLAKAGADIIAPSGMIDGSVAAIRHTLDENSLSNTIIMGYSAKYASGYYGPFREAAGSTPSFGDRRSYQMDPANADEALREIELDLEEGADIIMVKPALSYLDVIYRAKQNFNTPLAAYNVSGEYSMIKCAAEHGLIDGDRVMWESVNSIKRAGADLIITYFSKDLARLLGQA